jgi:hypothetical protein
MDPCEDGGFVFRVLQVNDSCNVGEESKRLLVPFIDHRENQDDLDDDYSSRRREIKLLRDNARSEMFQRNGEVLMNLSDDEQGESYEVIINEVYEEYENKEIGSTKRNNESSSKR